MRTVFSLSIVGVVVCVHLLYLNGSFGQTSSIEMGTFNYPIIYNETLKIPAVDQAWYQKAWTWISRKSKPTQNVTYTFPPLNQSTNSRCMIAGVNVMDVEPFGNGGLAKLISGGPNHANVTIRFTSKPGKDMIFRIIITGYCSYAPNQPYTYGKAEPLQSYNPHTTTDNSAIDSNFHHARTSTPSTDQQPATVSSAAAPAKKSWWKFW